MSEKDVVATVNRYISSLNHLNEEEISKALHFPHFRILPNGEFIHWDTPRTFFSWFKDRVKGDQWDHTKIDKIDAQSVSAGKYHAIVHFSRYRSDDSLIGKYFSLYIITHDNDMWGIKVGSGTG